jgi:hypothetical protein
LLNCDTAHPVDASAISLRFSLPARPDLGESTLDLRRSEPGVFTGAGPNLSLYTVHLSGGLAVQLYLVPGGPGANEFHVTFLDGAGGEPVSVHGHGDQLRRRRAPRLCDDPGAVAVTADE